MATCKATGEFGRSTVLIRAIYCLHEKHFSNKTWKSGVLEDLHCLGRDNGAFFEILQGFGRWPGNYHLILVPEAFLL